MLGDLVSVKFSLKLPRDQRRRPGQGSFRGVTCSSTRWEALQGDGGFADTCPFSLSLSGLCPVPGGPLLSSGRSLGRHGHLTSCVSSPFQPWAFTFQIERQPLTLCSSFQSLWLGHMLPLSLCPAVGERQEVVMIVRAMLVRHRQGPGDFPGRKTDVRGHYRSHPGRQPLNGFLDRTASCEFVTLWSISEAVGLACSHNISWHGWLRP